jgi:hypothetical protein
LTGGGTGGAFNSSTTQSSSPYVPFNGNGSGALSIASGIVPSLITGALIGALTLVLRM